MPPAPRILFVADPSAAVEALRAVREGGDAQAQLAPTADVLRDTLMAPDAVTMWDAIVFVPGGPVEEVEVAVFVPDGLPLFVVGADVPLLLTETAAEAIAEADLPGLLGRLAVALPPPSPDALDAAPPLSEVPLDLPVEDLLAPEPQPTPVPEPVPDADLWASDRWGDSASGSLPFAADTVAAVTDEAAAAFADEPATNDAPDPWAFESPFADAEVPPPPAGPASPAAPAPTEHLASLADHLPVGLYRSTPEGRILYANPALADLLGVDSVGALDALNVRTDLGYPREAFVDEIRETGAARNLIVSWQRRDGERVHTRENARALHGPDGSVLYYEGTMEDVTAEVEARREERSAARQHRAVAGFVAAAAPCADASTLHCAAAGALLDAVDADWACFLVRDGLRHQAAATAGQIPERLVQAVRQSGALAGWEPSETPLLAATPADLACGPEVVESLVRAEAFPFATVPVHKAGQPLGVLAWGRAGAEIEPADVRAAEALAWHVGAHLARAETVRELRDTEASLAVIAEHSPHVLYRLRYTADGPDFEYLSPAVEDLLGLPRAEIDARGGVGAFVESREILEGDGLAVGPVEGAEAYRALYRMTTTHGERWVENGARPWRDASGMAVGLVGVFQDVTEQKLREDRLADAAQTALIRQRALVDLAHLDGADAFGAAAAAVAAATLGASAVSFWLCAPGVAPTPLYAPPRAHGGPDPSFQAVLDHVGQHRALAIEDTWGDPRVSALGLAPFVGAYALRSLLVAPIRRHAEIAGLVVVHRTDEPHAWDAAETEFAAAVADAVALALERDDREQAVAALVEAREAAEAGRAAAERLNQLKDSFLSNMGHEIRTPLTGILGFADLLVEEVPDQHREFAELIARNGRRLLDTLNAVLDLSRLESGEVEAVPRPVLLRPLVEEAAARYAEEARERGLRFDLDLDADVAAQIDPDAVRQIVGHVVGNAVKFTDVGGVLVTVEGTPTEAVLRVADTGVGISDRFLGEACEAFSQEETGHARSHEGAGLGLTIACRLTDLLGGHLSIESERPGGTVVMTTFPRVDPPGQAPAARPAVPARPLPAFLSAPPAEPVGDGLAGFVPVVRARPRPASVPVPAPALDSVLAADLGTPFDFSFLTAAPPAPTAPTAPPSTDMFDFRFGRAPAAGPPPPDAAPVAPEPVAPEPGAPEAASSSSAPVLIVRARPSEHGPTIPELRGPEDAEVIDEPSDGRTALLVVEDNDDTRMLLERILGSAYAVTAVGDARAALLAMNRRRFAGLVLDINLGGKETGADVLRIARSLPDYGNVFAMALTAYALPGDRERLIGSGFDAYVSKPFTRQSLMETLAEAGVR